MSAALAAALGEALGEPVERLEPIAGGDLNDAFRARLAGGGRVFVKTARDAAPGAFAAEAAGLRWLAAAGAIALPDVLAVADGDAGRAGEEDAPTPARGAHPGAASAPAPRFLALSWIESGRWGARTDELLGRGLAALHGAGAPAFGGDGDMRIGPLALPNEPQPDWPAFYARCRIEPTARLAIERGALDPGAARLVERLAQRLPELAGEPEPPARLHGDLWGGNVLAAADGRPWLIDPAAHGGDREVDLAMLRLFGGPGPRAFAAYEEAFPLAAGHSDRVELWQLFPLLVHAALFGGGYGARALATLRRYAGC